MERHLIILFTKEHVHSVGLHWGQVFLGQITILRLRLVKIHATSAKAIQVKALSHHYATSNVQSNILKQLVHAFAATQKIVAVYPTISNQLPGLKCK